MPMNCANLLGRFAPHRQLPVRHQARRIPSPRRSSPRSRPCESDLLQLVTHATKIHGLWRNACALGVVDPQLYDVVEASWAHTIAAMQACS
ncbi:hypothetical protein DFH09DRAFT_1358575 [Mycena vulgaris]|nr:hypothetical protein DFH09DRAFT_1358575 [Mycena vulgaris]